MSTITEWLGKDPSTVVHVVLIALMLLLSLFGVALFVRLLRGDDVGVEVRNGSLGGVLAGYRASSTFVALLCYVLTLIVFAAICIPLSGTRHDEKKDTASTTQAAGQPPTSSCVSQSDVKK